MMAKSEQASDFVDGVQWYEHLYREGVVKMDTEEEAYEEAYSYMPVRGREMGTNTKSFDFIHGFMDGWKRDKENDKNKNKNG